MFHPATDQIEFALEDLFSYHNMRREDAYNWLSEGGFEGGSIVRLEWEAEERIYFLRKGESAEDRALEELEDDEDLEDEEDPHEYLYGTMGATFTDITSEVKKYLKSEPFEWEASNLFFKLSKKIWEYPERKSQRYYLSLLTYLLGRFVELLKYLEGKDLRTKGPTFVYLEIYQLLLLVLSSKKASSYSGKLQEFSGKLKELSLVDSYQYYHEAEEGDKRSGQLYFKLIDTTQVIQQEAVRGALEIEIKRQRMIDICYKAFSGYKSFKLFVENPTDDFEEFQEEHIDNFFKVLTSFEESWLKVSLQDAKDSLDDVLFQE